MKRFWLVLLSLGLIVAFSTSAMAVDVKFSGEYYAAGMYINKSTVQKDTTSVNQSTAFYFQRLRLKTDFVVSPGLILTTRMDIMEKAWGAARTTPGIAADLASSGTTAENENIAVDWAYLTYVSPIGIFTAGICDDGVWGTVFGDSSTPNARLAYTFVSGGIAAGVLTTKNLEQSRTAKQPGSTASDIDNDAYTAFVKYAWKSGQAGLLLKYQNYNQYRQAAAFVTNVYIAVPYAIVQLGPVKVQTELTYVTGKARDYQDPSTSTDIKKDSLAAWIDATADFGKVYVGGTAAYVSGDDPGTTDKSEDGSAGTDYNPCLIMWNFDRTYWAGSMVGYDAAAQSSTMVNAYFLQARVGVKPIDKLDIMASLSWAGAEKKPAGFLYNDYGYEIDVTGTYKITNNLSYMLGVGYLMTGRYYKGAGEANALSDNYLVINKLTLTF